MKWTMTEKGEDLLHTPVISLIGPFSEIPYPAFKSCLEPTSEKVHLGCDVQRFRKKQKVKRTVSAWNEIRKRAMAFLEGDESRKNQSHPGLSQLTARTNSLDTLEHREKFSLQLQKAMIADEDGDRPIHIAVAQEDLRLIKRLCFIMRKGGASLDLKNSLRQTPLHVAMIVGNHKTVALLLRYGASLPCQDRIGCNAVHLGVKYFKEKTFSTLLFYCHSNSALNAFDYDGLTALHHAVTSRNFVAVKGLCEAGADVDATDGKSGRSSLAHAVLSRDLDMVTLLLKFRARIDRTDYSGQNALELALHTGSRAIIKLLEKESPPDELSTSSKSAPEFKEIVPKVQEASSSRSRKRKSQTEPTEKRVRKKQETVINKCTS